MSIWLSEKDKISELIDNPALWLFATVVATTLLMGLYSWTRNDARAALEKIQGETGGWLDEMEPAKGNRINDR